MKNILDCKKKSENKFILYFIFVFVLGQLVIGFFLYNNFNISKQIYINHNLMYYALIYVKNLFILSSFILSSYILIINSQNVNNSFYLLIKKYTSYYFLISFFMTILSNGRIYTPISYLGNFVFNLLYGNVCENLCLTLKQIIFESNL